MESTQARILEPLTASEPWVAQALAGETRALLRPALVDLWYREGRLAAPAMLAGVWLGHHLHLNLSKQRLIQCMAVLLAASGASLLLRAFA